MKNAEKLMLQIKLENIDFMAIRRKLCCPNNEGGFGWEIFQADEAIDAYLIFLTEVTDFINENPGDALYHEESRLLFEKAVPESKRRMVAVVWETHILNTRQYVEDCQRIFKRYLHYSYNPFFSNSPVIEILAGEKVEL